MERNPDTLFPLSVTRPVARGYTSLLLSNTTPASLLFVISRFKNLEVLLDELLNFTVCSSSPDRITLLFSVAIKPLTVLTVKSPLTSNIPAVIFPFWLTDVCDIKSPPTYTLSFSFCIISDAAESEYSYCLSLSSSLTVLFCSLKFPSTYKVPPLIIRFPEYCMKSPFTVSVCPLRSKTSSRMIRSPSMISSFSRVHPNTPSASP